MRSFLLALALLSSGTVLAAESEDLAQLEEDAKFAYENGTLLLSFDSPKEIRIAIDWFGRALAADPLGKTAWHAAAQTGIEHAKGLLYEITEPARARASNALAAGNWFEAERALHDVVLIDPYDAESHRSLADVRAALRLQATELDRKRYPRLRMSLDDTLLGVPPAAERITNDPRFSIVPTMRDRG